MSSLWFTNVINMFWNPKRMPEQDYFFNQQQDKTFLSDSYEMARQRLSTVERKMIRGPQYKNVYSKQIKAYLKKGYTCRLTKQEANVTEKRFWYLPHFGIQTVNKPGKLRLVFDAATTVNKLTLSAAFFK